MIGLDRGLQLLAGVTYTYNKHLVAAGDALYDGVWHGAVWVTVALCHCITINCHHTLFVNSIQLGDHTAPMQYTYVEGKRQTLVINLSKISSEV